MISGRPNFLLGLVAATIFGGCCPDVRERPLSEVDLADTRAVAAIGKQLGARDQTAFITYALVHWPGSNSYCGHPLLDSASPPRTVGEAIESTLRFEERLAATRREEANAKTGSARVAERNQLLIDRYEALLLKKHMLSASAGAEAGHRAEIPAIDREMDRIRRERRQLAL